MENFNSSGNQRLVVDASALAARPSADPCFVDFDMLARRAADPVLIGPHHTSAQFVQDSEGGFISRQPKLPLELHPRHAGGLTGDQIGGPKPDAEWPVAALHDSADQEPGLASARAALQNAGTGDDAKTFATLNDRPLAVGANGVANSEPLSPGIYFLKLRATTKANKTVAADRSITIQSDRNEAIELDAKET